MATYSVSKDSYDQGPTTTASLNEQILQNLISQPFQNLQTFEYRKYTKSFKMAAYIHSPLQDKM